MLIIIEGPDGAGKTTLAENLRGVLAARREVHMLKKGPPSSHPLDEYEVPLHAYRPGSAVDVICDRWHWGERVYPDVLGRRSVLDEPAWLHIEMFLQARGALVVRLAAPLDVLGDRLRERGDDLVRVDQLSAVTIGYDRAHLASRLPVELVPAADLAGRDRTVQTVDRILTRARSLDASVRFLRPFTTYVGPPLPRVLLLGEVRNVIGPGSSPAFGPYPGTSGHYLLDVLGPWINELDDGGIRSGVGIANACDVDDPHALWRTLGSPRVVTLGVLAHRRCQMRHGAVPHPQYWRRFLNPYRAEYQNLIREAAETSENLSSYRPPGSWVSPPPKTEEVATA